MPDTIEDEIKEASIKQAEKMRLDALRKFGEDFDIDMRTEMKQVTNPIDVADVDPAAPEPVEEEGLDDQDGI